MHAFEAVAIIKSEILNTLGASERPPMHVSDREAAVILGVKTSTLAVWRCAGRYDLPYFKIGRNVRYRITDLAEFLARSVLSHTQ